jgi:hypothetical protein
MAAGLDEEGRMDQMGGSKRMSTKTITFRGVLPKEKSLSIPDSKMLRLPKHAISTENSHNMLSLILSVASTN